VKGPPLSSAPSPSAWITGLRRDRIPRPPAIKLKKGTQPPGPEEKVFPGYVLVFAWVLDEDRCWQWRSTPTLINLRWAGGNGGPPAAPRPHQARPSHAPRWSDLQSGGREETASSKVDITEGDQIPASPLGLQDFQGEVIEVLGDAASSKALALDLRAGENLQ